MPLLPVAAREARAASRSWRNYAWRTLIAAIGLALVPTVIATSKNPALLGKQLFSAFTMMAYLYAIIAGVLRTADSISEEKRENTLGLLFLTDLKAYDVLTGKLLTSTATIVFGLLAILPLLTIPLLMGGVTAQQLILVSLNLINTLFLSISFGFLFSTLLRQSWEAICLGLVTMFFLVLGLPRLVLQYVMGPSLYGDAIGRVLLLFSPSMAFDHVLNPSGIGAFLWEFYWAPLAATHLLAWLNIFLTLHYLPIVWRDKPRTVRGQRWWTRMQALRFGRKETRTKFRKRLLKSNPLFWLAGREQVSSSGLMTVLVGVVAISLTGLIGGIIFGLITLHSILLARMSSAASHSLAEDRKSGALELLLATSLSVREVLRGRWMALGRQFFGPILIVTFWHFFAFMWTFILLDSHSQLNVVIFCAFPVAVLAWLATGWSGMWFGLRARTTTMAMWITFAVVVVAPLFVLTFLTTATGQWNSTVPFRTRDAQTAAVMGLFLWSIYLCFVSSWSANRLRTNFREAATDRFSENLPFDPRPLRRFALRFATLVLAISLCVFTYHWTVNFRGERQFKKALAAHSELSLKPPETPYIPSEKNLATWDFFTSLGDPTVPYTVNRRQSTLRDLTLGYVHGTADIAWIVGKKSVIGQTALARRRLDHYQNEYARLHTAASERPFLRFIPNDTYIQAVALLQYHLVFRAASRIEFGERPLDDVLLALRFANTATNFAEDFIHLEPLIVRSIQPVYDGILKNTWTDQDLATIQRAYQQIDLFPVFDQWRLESTRRLVNFFADESATTVNISNHSFSKNPKQTKLRGRIRETQAAAIKWGLEELPKHVDNQKRTVHLNNYGGPIVDFSYISQQALRQLARAQTAVDLVVIACAIERFRLANNRLPQNLSELSPQYLKQIPNDIVCGLPLKYRPDADQKSYVLYSMGFDFLDNNGTAKNWAQGYGEDWGWICKR